MTVASRSAKGYIVPSFILGIDQLWECRESILVFQIAIGKRRIKSKDFWAEFRVKRDKRRGDYYIDVLAGRRRHFLDHVKYYYHVGINLDQTLRFCEGRGVLTAMTREIDSKQRGRLADETVRFKPPGGAGAEFRFQVNIDEPTKTITPKFEEVTLKESND